MRRSLRAMSLLGGAAAFGAAGLSLALLGLGLPFLLAALLASICAGLLIYSVGRWALARAAAARQESSAELGPDLGHELRGALSPALMVTDRLLNHDDPAVRRAGQTVLRSVERATELIAVDKRPTRADQDSVTPPAA